MTNTGTLEQGGGLGDRLHFTRQLAGVPARELDRLAGRSEGHCAIIEGHPEVAARTDTIAAYARALGVTTDYLILGTGKAPTEKSVRRAVEAARARLARATR
jgi:hypothetical protein